VIGYFVKAGDYRLDPYFKPYRLKFRDIIKDHISSKNYGDDLILILVEYHLEGQFLQLPKEPVSVGRYKKNERAISVVIGVSRNFQFLSDIEKKQFVVNTTIAAIQHVKIKMEKMGLTKMDFSQLLEDVQKCAKIYFETEITSK